MDLRMVFSKVLSAPLPSIVLAVAVLIASSGCASGPSAPAKPAQDKPAASAPEKAAASAPAKSSSGAQEKAKPAAKPVVWNIVGGPEGSSNLAVSNGAFPLVSKWLGNVTLLPVAAASAPAMRNVEKDQNLHGVVVAQGNLEELWTNTGDFAQNPVKGRKLLQTNYFLESAFFLIARKDSGIKTYNDLIGKKISVGDAKWSFAPKVVEGLKLMGILDKLENKYMAAGELPEALKTGAVQAVIASIAGDNSISSWVQEIVLANPDLVALDMTEQQKKSLGGVSGMAFKHSSARTFGRDMGIDKIPAVAWFYGLQMAEDTDPEIVYGITKAMIERRNEFAPIGASLASFIAGENWKEITSGAISSAPNAPVHPGAAKYYREVGLWKDGWKEYKK